MISAVYKRRGVLFSFMLFFSCNACSAYSFLEGCEIVVAAARCPIILSARYAHKNHHDLNAAYLDIASDCVRLLNGFLHIVNKPHDQNYHEYSWLFYDLVKLGLDGEKLQRIKYLLHEKNNTRIELNQSPIKNATLTTGEVILPFIEITAAVCEGIENRESLISRLYRARIASCGALARSFSCILEEDQSSLEQKLAIAMFICSLYLALKNLNERLEVNPVQAAVAPHPGDDHPGALPQGVIDILAQILEDGQHYDYGNAHPHGESVHNVGPVVPVAADGILNDADPVSLENFSDLAPNSRGLIRLRRLACAHGMTEDSFRAFNGNCNTCPICRQIRTPELERTVLVDPHNVRCESHHDGEAGPSGGQ